MTTSKYLFCSSVQKIELEDNDKEQVQDVDQDDDENVDDHVVVEDVDIDAGIMDLLDDDDQLDEEPVQC